MDWGALASAEQLLAEIKAHQPEADIRHSEAMLAQLREALEVQQDNLDDNPAPDPAATWQLRRRAQLDERAAQVLAGALDDHRRAGL